MKLKVFSIFDSKAAAFNTPFFYSQKGQAVRAFSEMANDSQTQICRHAGDFALFELGEFDLLKGTIEAHTTPLSLGLAQEFKGASQ